jgi:DNA-binding CsgD family transcriptional regulator
MEYKQKNISILILLGCIAVSFFCDWIEPERITFVLYSFFEIMLYTVRDFLCCLLILELLEYKYHNLNVLYEIIVFIPVVISGSLLVSSVAFYRILLYAKVVTIIQTILSLYLTGDCLFCSKKTGECNSLNGLSRRETDVADLLLEGKRTDEIADLLFISRATVKTHIQNIYRKYNVTSRMEFANKVHNHPNG